MSATSFPARLGALDGLRAVACAMVFVYHAYPFRFPGGFLGVDVFFVISGFVITRSLLGHGVEFGRFYRHRFFRIAPPAIVVVAAVALLGAAGSAIAPRSAPLIAIAGVMNWAIIRDEDAGGALIHYWSLAVEEQFYLLWPLALSALVRVRRPVAMLAVAIAALSAWQLWLATHGASFYRSFNGLDTRAVELLAGCVIAFAPPQRRWIARLGYLPLAALLVAGLFVDTGSAFYRLVGIPFATILSALAVMQIVAACATPHRLLDSAALQWGGSRSYALYLWHFPLLKLVYVLTQRSEVRTWVPVAISLALTCLLAELTNRLVERPARRLRDRLDRRTVSV